jgi:molybdate transport system regulatory protein
LIQIELLKGIPTFGSISGEVNALGIGYKMAWDRVDTMNNMAGQPLVTRSASGAQGGGTMVTELG